jgi:hypothetical protein
MPLPPSLPPPPCAHVNQLAVETAAADAAARDARRTQAMKARTAHAQWKSPTSDVVTLVNVCRAYDAAVAAGGAAAAALFCAENFLRNKVCFVGGGGRGEGEREGGGGHCLLCTPPRTPLRGPPEYSHADAQAL